MLSVNAHDENERLLRRHATGRASVVNPANRFERIYVIDAATQTDSEDGSPRDLGRLPTRFWDDRTQTLISANDSPDLPFRFSLNPYRGCEHGCAYCYARPGHEFLGMNAGIDFESQILVKREAAAILRRELGRPGWTGEPLAMAGVTDCYQPAERDFRITRQCLEVLCAARQAFSIITKNALVLRDLDLLASAARRSTVHVYLSVTTLNPLLARRLEPRTSTPAARLATIRELAAAGVPTAAMIAPVIPGLTDEELPALLGAVKSAGAQTAAFQLLRLPGAVAPLFLSWLQATVPTLAARVEARIRDCRQGAVSDARFGCRMRGEGPYAEAIAGTFRTFRDKFGLDRPLPALDVQHFRPPRRDPDQLLLFPEHD
jgi:DNA repair photolyase